MAIKKKVVKSSVAKTSKVTTNKTVKKNKPISKPQQPETTDSLFMVTCPKVALKNAINLVANALPSKEYNDAKSGVFIEAKNVGDKSMVFFTTNSLDVFISHGIEVYNDIEDGFVIPNGNTFKKIVNGLQNMNEQIEMYLDNDEFNISCGDEYSSTLQHYDESGFVFPPSDEEIKENEEISIPMKYLDEAISKISFACSTDLSVPELTGILIEQNSDGINIVGADGNKLAYFGVKSKIKKPTSVIVGVKYFKLLNQILHNLEIKENDIVNFYLSNDKIYFIHGNTTIGIQIFAGEYPIDGGYSQFIIEEKSCDISLVLSKDKFKEKIELAVLHNDNVNIPIRMVIDEKKKKYSLSNSYFSSNKFDISFDIDKIKNNSGNNNIDVTFMPSYLLDVLGSIKSKQIYLSLQSLDGPVIVSQIGINDYDYKYVFSLN